VLHRQPPGDQVDREERGERGAEVIGAALDDRAVHVVVQGRGRAVGADHDPPPGGRDLVEGVAGVGQGGVDQGGAGRDEQVVARRRQVLVAPAAQPAAHVEPRLAGLAGAPGIGASALVQQPGRLVGRRAGDADAGHHEVG
jgi:hypothetical protein